MSDNSLKSLVVQFAKWPDMGKVKTRLAKDLGDVKAREVHCELMALIAQNIAKGCGYQQALSLSRIDEAWPKELSRLNTLIAQEGILIHEQVQGDLGERMASAVSSSLEHFCKVIIVGSDCPAIDSSYIESAFDALEENDLVLGPAEDGGYVLIGASRFDARIFSKVEWGQPRVRQQTLDNAKALGFEVAQLAMTWDVDELEDYERWIELKKKAKFENKITLSLNT